MEKEEGITALKELGMSSIEVDELIHIEKLRRKNKENEEKKAKAVKIVRSMVL